MVKRKELYTENKAVRFTKTQMNDIERISDKLMITPSHLIRNLTVTALNDAKLLERIGLLKIVNMVRMAEGRKKVPFKETVRA